MNLNWNKYVHDSKIWFKVSAIMREFFYTFSKESNINALISSDCCRVPCRLIFYVNLRCRVQNLLRYRVQNLLRSGVWNQLSYRVQNLLRSGVQNPLRYRVQNLLRYRVQNLLRSRIQNHLMSRVHNQLRSGVQNCKGSSYIRIDRKWARRHMYRMYLLILVTTSVRAIDILWTRSKTLEELGRSFWSQRSPISHVQISSMTSTVIILPGKKDFYRLDKKLNWIWNLS